MCEHEDMWARVLKRLDNIDAHMADLDMERDFLVKEVKRLHSELKKVKSNCCKYNKGK